MMNTQKEWEGKRGDGLVEYESRIGTRAYNRRTRLFRCREIGLNDYHSIPEIAEMCGRHKDSVELAIEMRRPYWVTAKQIVVVDGAKPAPDSLRGQWFTRREIAEKIGAGYKWVTGRVANGVFHYDEPDPERRRCGLARKGRPARGESASTHGIPHLNVFTSLPRVV